ncbi:MAG: molybdopterin-dependent oxidoreductase [Actinomycetes bacterium]
MDRPDRLVRQHIVRGLVAGLLSAAAALGVAELIAAILGNAGSPVIAVGSTFVDATPRWLKEFAIQTFGENDKNALLVGIGVTIALVAAAIGIVAQWRPRAGVVAVGVLGLVPAVAAVSRPTGRAIDAIPAIAGAVVGAGFLWVLSRPSPELSRARAEVGDAANPRAATSDSTLSRRSFLLVASAAAVVAATAGVVGRVLISGRMDVEALRGALRLPAPTDPAPTVPANVDLKVAGLSSFITPNAEFYRIDTALAVPYVDADSWRLRIHGMVEHEASYSFDDLLSMPLIERDVTLTCVSNEVGGELIGNARWLGVSLQRLLQDVRPASDASQVVSRSVDGMTIGTPVQALLDGRDAMLAVGMNGEPLPVEHGFPVRMVVPGLYGYVSACKWLTDMEFTTFDAYDAYWVQRGWVPQAPIKLSSRIDTPRQKSHVSGDVTVAGVAWEQHVGVKAVEVQVDGGDWQVAQLAASGGIDSWRQWVWQWQAPSSGAHTLAVRATDADGNVQTGELAEPFPSGATGWHQIEVTVD